MTIKTSASTKSRMKVIKAAPPARAAVPRNLLVCKYIGTGKIYIKAFNLNEKDWLIVNFGGALGGRAFDKIVVVPHYSMSVLERQYIQEYIDQIKCRLSSPESGFFIL